MEGRACIGGVLCNSKGDVMCSFSAFCGNLDAISAEICAIHKACSLCLYNPAFIGLSNSYADSLAKKGLALDGEWVESGLSSGFSVGWVASVFFCYCCGGFWSAGSVCCLLGFVYGVWLVCPVLFCWLPLWLVLFLFFCYFNKASSFKKKKKVFETCICFF